MVLRVFGVCLLWPIVGIVDNELLVDSVESVELGVFDERLVRLKVGFVANEIFDGSVDLVFHDICDE